MDKLIEMKGISKAFGKNQALDCVDFYCNPGEILCLLGENGAGKTTLMKILYGMYKNDAGEIFYKGQRVEIQNPRVAISMGIQMVHQHFMLVNPMSVVDNIMIGKEPGSALHFNRKKAREIVKQLMEEYGLKVPLDKQVKDISVGEQQRVEIIKALYHGADVLILDEPTAVLTPQEVEELFDIIRRLRENNKTVIVITHKLKEVMAISDRIYVLRHGKKVAERMANETNMGELSRLMVGETVVRPAKKRFNDPEVVVSLRHVAWSNEQKVQVLKDIDFDIHGHEIVGIAGVEGNGQAELIDLLCGLKKGFQGEILYRGENVAGKSCAELLEMGLTCIHADRQAQSIALQLSVPYNLMMGYQNGEKYAKNGLVDWKKLQESAAEMMETFDVRPKDTSRCLYEFSGGNQQKFVVGREVMREPQMMIAAHPTRGVDIMATAHIHEELNRLKEQGAGVLLISSDLDELMEMSDRIVVLYDGTTVDSRDAGEYTLMDLGRLMGGGKA